MVGPVRGRELQISWRSRPVRAWLPDPVGTEVPELSAGTARRTERARAALIRASDRLPHEWEALARLLLRAEGVASSFVEGVRAPIVAVAAAEVDERLASPTAAWVADNLAAITLALTGARRGPLRTADLQRWHARLMVHSHLPEQRRGTFRSEQGWIGGTSPLDAAFVPPPPEHLEELMDDLVALANRFDLDPVTQAAVVHAQFETVHPYADGNGRMGRLLIGWVLVRRTDVVLPPPVSVLIARDPGGYLSGLHLFRTGQLDAWVSWFAEQVERSAVATIGLVEHTSELIARWTRLLGDLRADATARRLVGIVPEAPVLSAPLVAERLEVSPPAARGAIAALVERGVLRPIDLRGAVPGHPASWYVADGLLDLVRNWPG